MKKLALCLTAGIAVLLPASATGTSSTFPQLKTRADFRAYYLTVCKTEQSWTASFDLLYGVGPHHLHAVQRCVAKLMSRVHVSA